MSPAVSPSRQIDARGRTVRELLAGRKYSIDYYQREYKWQQKQVRELLDDLAAKFLESHEEGNERSAVANYAHYFLGSTIISDKDGNKFIIDGQQRLTTLTLLLIFLQHQLEDVEQKGQIADLIFSQKYGERSFNLDIAERTACMEALYKGKEFSDATAEAQESVANILARYSDIEELFPEELQGPALPYFVDWLVENVQLVEITAYSDEDAYTIFETMNDRGLSLTPADMLKGTFLRTSWTPRSALAQVASGRRLFRPLPSSARTRMLTGSRLGCEAGTLRASASANVAQVPRTSILLALSFTAGCAITRTTSALE